MTPFEGTSTCIETARPLQLLEVLSSVCALVFLSSRSLTSLQTSGGPLTSSRITPDSLLPFVHPPPLSSLVYLLAFVLAFFLTTVNSCISSDIFSGISFDILSENSLFWHSIWHIFWHSRRCAGPHVQTEQDREEKEDCHLLSKSIKISRPSPGRWAKKTKQIPLSGL